MIECNIHRNGYMIFPPHIDSLTRVLETSSPVFQSVTQLNVTLFNFFYFVHLQPSRKL